MSDNEGEEKFQMAFEQHEQMVIYSLSVQIQTKMVYEYRYSVGNKNENMFRGYEYNQEDPNQIDQWNKVWCKYQFTFNDKKFIQGFNVFVRDSKNHSIQLMNISKDIISGYELVDLDNHPKNRQLCFISKQIRGQQEKIEEHQQIINITRIDELSSNHMLITFKEVDANAKTRIKAYSEIYEGYNNLMGIELIQSQRINELQCEMSKHKIQNQEIYEKQKQSMEQEFNNFKEYSQQIIQKYIDENERAIEKIRELEYEKVNFQSEEIKIQEFDTDLMSQEDLTNLQNLQESLREYKSKVDQMKEEEKFINQRHEQQKCKITQKACELKRKSEESMLELQKCQKQLDKCLKSQEIAKYEKEETLKNANEHQLKYKEKLKETYQQLKSQEEELRNQILRQKEIEKKFEQMQAEHLQQKEEFQQKFNNLRENQSEQFQKQNEITVKQFSQIIENVNEVKQEQETNDNQSETNLDETEDIEVQKYYQNNESIQNHKIYESKFAFILRIMFRLILILLLYWFLYFVMPK